MSVYSSQAGTESISMNLRVGNAAKDSSPTAAPFTWLEDLQNLSFPKSSSVREQVINYILHCDAFWHLAQRAFFLFFFFLFWSTDVQGLPTASDSSVCFKGVIIAQLSWPLGPYALKPALSKSFPPTPDLWRAHFRSQIGPLAPSSGIRCGLIAEAVFRVEEI